jgi:hypothetical protein
MFQYTSLINLAVKSQFSSTLIASFLSYANRWSFCLIGFAVGEMCKECSINSLGTLGMCAGFHANTSVLVHKKLMSAPS